MPQSALSTYPKSQLSVVLKNLLNSSFVSVTKQSPFHYTIAYTTQLDRQLRTTNPDYNFEFESPAHFLQDILKGFEAACKVGVDRVTVAISQTDLALDKAINQHVKGRLFSPLAWIKS